MKRWARYFSGVLCFCVTAVTGCAVARGTGKAAWGVTKVGTTVAWETAKLAGKGVKTSVHLMTGTTVVPLRRQGNSLFAAVRINRKVTTELLVDTGASLTQISSALAARLGIKASSGVPVTVRVADGRAVQGRQVYLKEVRIGGAVVKNVPAVVLPQYGRQGHEGLLGMTFLNEFVFQIDSEKGALTLRKRMN